MKLFKMAKQSIAGAIIIACSTASAVDFKFSDAGVPSDAHIKGMEVFNQELNRLSGGEHSVKVYHSNQLLNKTAEVSSIRRGDGKVDFIFMDLNFLADYIPEIGMLSSSYLFTDVDHMLRILNGSIGDEVRDLIAKKTGMRMLDAFYLGTRNLNINAKGEKIKTPADMSGIKLRMPGSRSWQNMGKSLGATPTPLAFSEVYMGLMTGTIDAQDNPLPTTKNAKFYEVTDTIVMTNHFINPLYVAVNDKWWNKQPKEEQKLIQQALSIATKGITQEVLNTEADIVSFFEKEGMNIIEPNRQAFIKYARDFYKESGLSKKWDKDLYNEIVNN